MFSAFSIFCFLTGLCEADEEALRRLLEVVVDGKVGGLAFGAMVGGESVRSTMLFDRA